MKRVVILPILISLLAIRIVLSIVISDGKLRSDSLNYIGLSLNIEESFTFTAMIPVDEKAFSGGITVREAASHFQEHPSRYRRLMNYQWLHSLVYLPVIMLFRSLYAVIVLNNLFFFGAGFFLFAVISEKVNARVLIIGWIIFLFFPPFFYVTNQFFSEPLFVFLLAFIVYRIVSRKPIDLFFITALVLFSVTRGFGLFVTAGFLITALVSKEWKNAAVYAACGFSAIALNMLAGADIRDDRFITIESPPPVIHSVYFSNTIHGNGDNDYFLEYPEKQKEDPFFSEFLEKKHSSLDVAGEVVKQNVLQPVIFLRNAWNKTSAYFLNVIPDSWGYRNTVQPLYRKILWSLQNIALIGLMWFGLKRSEKRFRGFFTLLFWISFAAHFIALSRYRYFQPVLIIGFPAVILGISSILERYAFFKSNNALPK